MANILDIAMADGILAGAEKDLLNAYVTSFFQMLEETITGIVDIIAVKNDFTIFEQIAGGSTI